MDSIDITPTPEGMSNSLRLLQDSVTHWNAQIDALDRMLDRESWEGDRLYNACRTNGQKQLLTQALEALQDSFVESRDAQQQYLDEKLIQRWNIVFYEVGQAYGGPEEGGWWYDTGFRTQTTIVFMGTREQAFARCRHANQLMQRFQRKHTEVYSVSYRGGRYSAQVFKASEEIPEQYPSVRPHYE